MGPISRTNGTVAPTFNYPAWLGKGLSSKRKQEGVERKSPVNDPSGIENPLVSNSKKQKLAKDSAGSSTYKMKIGTLVDQVKEEGSMTTNHIDQDYDRNGV
ncbi:hypothetical protein FRB93_008669 [Tulasnella sp. JGI-2019a]|nr:hypothetical protein FRB93_008669 [Tulasnella sp. JGI-2019a]